MCDRFTAAIKRKPLSERDPYQKRKRGLSQLLLGLQIVSLKITHWPAPPLRHIVPIFGFESLKRISVLEIDSDSIQYRLKRREKPSARSNHVKRIHGHSDFSPNKWKMAIGRIKEKRYGRIRFSIIRLRLSTITRIPPRTSNDGRIKGRKLLDFSSSRAESIDYPMTHLKENYYPSNAANLHYGLFSSSGAIRNRHFRSPHDRHYHFHRRRRHCRRRRNHQRCEKRWN